MNSTSSGEYIGRKEELKKARLELFRASRGKGNTLIVSGETGVGTTSFIEESYRILGNNIDVGSGHCLKGCGPIFPISEINKDLGIKTTVGGPDIYEIFLISGSDSILLKRMRKGGVEPYIVVDEDTFASMGEAVLQFGEDIAGIPISSFGWEGDKNMKRYRILSYVNEEIPLVRSHYSDDSVVEDKGPIVLANTYMIFEGRETDEMDNRVEELNRRFLEKYGDHLISFDGDIERFAGCEKIYGPLFEREINFSRIDVIREEMMLNIFGEIEKKSYEKPLVIHIDNLQDADNSAMTFFHWLSRNIRDNNILLIGSYKSDGDVDKLNNTLSGMREEGLITEIKLKGLSSKETENIISYRYDCRPPEDFIKKIYEETYGNPSFVNEYLSYLEDEGVVKKSNEKWDFSIEFPREKPKGVRDIFEYKLKDVDNEQRKILGYASVIGNQFSFNLLRKSLGMEEGSKEEEGLEEQIYDLIEKKIIKIKDEDEYIFEFERIGVMEYLYDNFPKIAKRNAHKNVGNNIEEIDPLNYSTLARHFIRGVVPEKIITYSIRAGDDAANLSSLEEALGYYESAIKYLDNIEEEGQKDLLKKAIDIGKLCGLAFVPENTTRLLNISRKTKDKENEILALTELGRYEFLEGRKERSMDYYNTAIEISNESNDKRKSIEIKEKMGDLLRGGKEDDLVKALNICESGLKDAEEEKFEDLVNLFNMRIGSIYINLERYGESEKLNKICIKKSKELKDDQIHSMSLHNLGVVYKNTNRLEDSIKMFRESIEIGNKIGYSRLDMYCHSNLADVYLKMGDINNSELEVDETLNIAKKKIGEKKIIATSYATRGAISAERGDKENFEKWYGIALPMLEKTDSHAYADNLKDFAGYYEKIGDKENAIIIYKKAYGAFQSIKNKEMVAEIGRKLNFL